MSPPLVPSLDHDLHFVLCDFGKNGHAFVETDPAYADRNTIISNLIAGEYERPLNVIDSIWPKDGLAMYRKVSRRRS